MIANEMNCKMMLINLNLIHPVFLLIDPKPHQPDAINNLFHPPPRNLGHIHPIRVGVIQLVKRQNLKHIPHPFRGILTPEVQGGHLYPGAEMTLDKKLLRVAIKNGLFTTHPGKNRQVYIKAIGKSL